MGVGIEKFRAVFEVNVGIPADNRQWRQSNAQVFEETFEKRTGNVRKRSKIFEN